MSLDHRLLADFVHLDRVQKIFDRYCREGKRPSREEAKAWLESEGWQPAPLASLFEDAANEPGENAHENGKKSTQPISSKAKTNPDNSVTPLAPATGRSE